MDIPTTVTLSEDGSAVEVEGSDLYLTHLFQKNITKYLYNCSHPERKSRRLCSRMGITSEGQVYANEIISKIITNVNKYPTLL